jgi:hypothetical protein
MRRPVCSRGRERCRFVRVSRMSAASNECNHAITLTKCTNGLAARSLMLPRRWPMPQQSKCSPFLCQLCAVDAPILAPAANEGTYSYIRGAVIALLLAAAAQQPKPRPAAAACHERELLATHS